MKKEEIVKVEQKQDVYYCDSCGTKIGTEQDCFHQSAIQMCMTGIGYAAYSEVRDSEWNYTLCRRCATALKDFIDTHNNLQKLPESKE